MCGRRLKRLPPFTELVHAYCHGKSQRSVPRIVIWEKASDTNIAHLKGVFRFLKTIYVFTVTTYLLVTYLNEDQPESSPIFTIVFFENGKGQC